MGMDGDQVTSGKIDFMDGYVESIVTGLYMYNQRTESELIWVELWHTSTCISLNVESASNSDFKGPNQAPRASIQVLSMHQGPGLPLAERLRPDSLVPQCLDQPTLRFVRWGRSIQKKAFSIMEKIPRLSYQRCTFVPDQPNLNAAS